MQSTKIIPDRNIFSERLKSLRLQRGFSGLEMADFLGFSQPVYSRYENGRVPDVNTVTAIADSLSVSVDWLLGRNEKNAQTESTDQSHLQERDLPAQVFELHEDYKTMRKTLDKLTAQMETVTALLGNALANSLGNEHDAGKRKKAG